GSVPGALEGRGAGRLHRVAGDDPAPSAAVSDSTQPSVAESVPPPAAGAAAPGATLPAGAWGPARAFGGLVALIVAAIVEVGIVAAFDPDLSSLAAKPVAQALRA